MTLSYGEPYQAAIDSLVDILDILPDDMLATCTRDIDRKHLDDMRAAGVESMPPLDTVLYDGKLVLVGGYHRLELWKEQEAETVPVRSKMAQTPIDVMLAAYDSNREHGAAWDKGTKTAFALWLYHKLENGPEPITLTEVARRAGLAISALSTALKKERRQAQENGQPESSERYASAADDLIRSLATFYKSERSLGVIGSTNAAHLVTVRAKKLAETVLSKKNAFKQAQELHSLAASLERAAQMVESRLTGKATANA